MGVFRVFLAAIFVTIAGYTAVVAANHGMGLLPVFFGDMAKFDWPGQFNLDFLCMLALSATWVSWRHRFSGPGLLLGGLAFFGGAFFISAYLLVVLGQVNGDPRRLLLGEERAAG